MLSVVILYYHQHYTSFSKKVVKTWGKVRDAAPQVHARTRLCAADNFRRPRTTTYRREWPSERASPYAIMSWEKPPPMRAAR
jgi:hypothetical protein